MKAGTPESTGGTEVQLGGTWGVLDPVQGGTPERTGVGGLGMVGAGRHTRPGSLGFWRDVSGSRVWRGRAPFGAGAGPNPGSGAEHKGVQRDRGAQWDGGAQWDWGSQRDVGGQ